MRKITYLSVSMVTLVFAASVFACDGTAQVSRFRQVQQGSCQGGSCQLQQNTVQTQDNVKIERRSASPFIRTQTRSTTQVRRQPVATTQVIRRFR